MGNYAGGSVCEVVGETNAGSLSFAVLENEKRPFHIQPVVLY